MLGAAPPTEKEPLDEPSVAAKAAVDGISASNNANAIVIAKNLRILLSFLKNAIYVVLPVIPYTIHMPPFTANLYLDMLLIA
jgi:hypothetical protein